MRTIAVRGGLADKFNGVRARGCLLALAAWLGLTGCLVYGQPAPGGGGGGTTNSNPWLDSWSFNDTSGWTSDLSYAPIAFTNLTWAWYGDWNTLVVDSTNAAWLQYHVTESNGTTNLTVDQGTVTLWFAPSSWASTNLGGTGPGVWGRLLEVGSYNTNNTGWWSLYLDDVGANIYFSAQTNGGSPVNYLAMPFAWTNNLFHQIALTYCATNTALYLDGWLVTNGPGMTVWPGPNVLTNGFFVGSDSSGVLQVHGMIDDLYTYNYPLTGKAVLQSYDSLMIYYLLNPMNPANQSPESSAPSSSGPAVTAISGTGFLQPLGAAAVSITSSNVWLTNLVYSLGANLTASFKFDIQGGYDNLLYDVFANAALAPSSPGYQWAWMGQGYHGNTYQLTNLPLAASFLILGTPLDSDFDGYTDAYERLVAHSNPYTINLSGDGLADLYKIQHGLTLGGVVAVPALSSITVQYCSVP